MYYEINEETARRAKEMSSFYDYKPGSATAAYRAQVDEAAALAGRQSERFPEHANKIAALLDRYARNLAAWYNKENEISCRCPSVMIAGPSNFPVRKKQKQISAWDRNREFYNQTQSILSRIRSIGTGGIQANDPAALEKLTVKLERLQKSHQAMKDTNAYYRKNKTLDGCPHITPEEADKIKSMWERGWYVGVPFASYSLQNSNAEIKRIKDRIASLQSAQAAPAVEEKESGYTYREDTQLMRVQLIFDDKPDADTRALLKANGFRWAPSQNAWQRQLTDNGKRAAREVISKL